MTQKEIQLLTIGDCSVDLYMRIDTQYVAENDAEICFVHGSKVPVSEFGTAIAGNACNVAVGAKLLGVNTAIYTITGQDENGTKVLETLHKYNVITDYCQKDRKKPTNVHAVIVAGKEGERTIFSYHAPREYALPNMVKPKWIFYTSLAKGFEEFQQELVQYLSQNRDIGVTFNPGSLQLQAGPKALKNFLDITDILFVNATEAQILTNAPEQVNINNEEELITLHGRLQELGPKLTVITLGSNGSSAFDGEKLYREPILDLEMEIKDKTGAGDAYTAGFLSAIIQGKSVKTAMRWGAVNSSHVIRKIGALEGLQSLKQMETNTL